MKPKACKIEVPRPHPFLFTTEWLEKVGYTGSFGALDRDAFFTGDFLKKLATVVRSDGSFNGYSPFAERVAILLAKNGHVIDATVLFLKIVDTRRNVLFILEESRETASWTRRVQETADTHGRLGYLGTLLFGEAAFKSNRKELAKKLFLELVERIPAEGLTVALSDARIHALEGLQRLQVKTLPISGRSVTRELEYSLKHNP